MKLTRYIATVIASLFLLAIMALMITGNEHLFKAIGNTYLKGRTGPSIDEFSIFENRKVEAGNFIDIPKSKVYGQVSGNADVLHNIETYDPTALIILRNDSLIYEKYWGLYQDVSITNSFSVAKSIVGLCVGIAVDHGYIQSLDQKVVDFVPELQGEFRDSLTIRNLLSMNSGMNFNESYGDPFGFMAKAYYGDDLLRKTLSYEAESKPGDSWSYLGGNTMLLSIIIERSAKTTLSQFVSDYLWKPLGAEKDALWNLDEKDGIEKAYCCFYATALDFARIGLLVTNSGKVFDRQIISAGFMEELKKPIELNDKSLVNHYSKHWWLLNYRDVEIVYARGILGQYIITIPSENLVVVRLGHRRGEKDEHNHPIDVYHYVDFALSLN